MRDWKSLLGVILIFALGGLAGGFAALALVHHRTTVFLQRGSLAYEQLLERRLSRGLHLDADQRERFHETFMANIEARKKIQAGIQPQMRELNGETRQQLKSILTPEQVRQFRRNLTDFRLRFGSPGLSAPKSDSLDHPALTTNTVPEAEEIGTNQSPEF